MSTVKYNFEWDPKKASSNRAKHGVSFDEAATIFRDARALSILDGDHGQQEERWISVGLSEMGQLLVVCHTFREETSEASVIRIFSTRKATKQERLHYEK